MMMMMMMVVLLRLIEEFMLLANMAVAHRLQGAFPRLALLRRHPSPKLNKAEDLVRFLLGGNRIPQSLCSIAQHSTLSWNRSEH